MRYALGLLGLIQGATVFTAACSGGMEAPVLHHPTMSVTALNDHLLYFFDGRNPTIPRYSADFNWLDDAAMKLGVGTYVIHQGGDALVYDTFPQPAQAAAVRDYLEQLGIRNFTVTLSHWHLDHVGGLSAWSDVPSVATTLNRDTLVARTSMIKTGTDPIWGPPPIDPLVIPTEVFDGVHPFQVGSLTVEARNINIHSRDTSVLYLAADRILLSGDTLEDELTYMVEFDGLPDHVANLRVMRGWDVAQFFPNHGDPDTIRHGGYGPTFIDATINYISAMLMHSHDPDFLSLPVEQFVGESIAKGWVHSFDPYRDVHAQNLQGVSSYWKDRPLPQL